MKERDRLPRQHSTNSIKHNHLLLSMIEEAQHARRPVISMGNAFMVNYYNLNSMAAIIIIPLPTKFSQTISASAPLLYQLYYIVKLYLNILQCAANLLPFLCSHCTGDGSPNPSINEQPLIQASPGSILIAQSITTYKTFRDG